MNEIKVEEISRCPLCSSDKNSSVGTAKDFEYETSALDFNYCQCESCSLVFLKNRPAKSEISRIYPDHYHNYIDDGKESLVYKVKNFLDQKFFKSLPIPKESNFLDIGCSNGRMLNIARKTLQKNSIIEGVEFSESNAKQAIEKSFHVYVGSIEDMDIPVHRFHIVYMQQVIEHLFNPVAVIQKIHTLLKANGLLLIETPTSECLDFELFHRRYWGGYHCPRHFHIWNKKSIATLAQKCGFEIVFYKYKPQPIHWIWTFHHWLKEKKMPAFVYERFHMKNAVLVGIFTLVEIALILLYKRSSNTSILLRRKETN